MILRNGKLAGGSTGRLQEANRPAFEEAVSLILHRWTALSMAVENEWGGRDSLSKADLLFDDILGFFYNRDDHFSDDLELVLESTMLEDFNTEVQDGSPGQVAKELVGLHNDFLCGRTKRLQQLREAALEQSLGLMSMNRKKDQQHAAENSSSSSSGSEEVMDTDTEADGAPTPAESRLSDHAPRKGPIIDDEGFQLVTGRRGGRQP